MDCIELIPNIFHSFLSKQLKYTHSVRNLGLHFYKKVGRIGVSYEEVCFMAYVISNDCLSCGACEATCPIGAIAMGSDHFEIDAGSCIECGSCAAACPVGAISQE